MYVGLIQTIFVEQFSIGRCLELIFLLSKIGKNKPPKSGTCLLGVTEFDSQRLEL